MSGPRSLPARQLGQRRAVALEIAGHYLGMRIATAEVESILSSYVGRCSPPFPEREVRSLVRDLARRDRAKAAAGSETEHPSSHSDADGPIIVRLSDVRPEPVTWLWRDRIPRGKLTLVIGEPGDGKTWVLCDINARLSQGRAWPDGTAGVSGESVTLTAEDGLADTIRPRIDRQGGDAARCHVLRAIREGAARSARSPSSRTWSSSSARSPPRRPC